MSRILFRFSEIFVYNYEEFVVEYNYWEVLKLSINKKNSIEFKLNLGKRIRDARLKVGLTQSQLAEYLGKSDNVVTNWEKGTNRPDADMINKLCAILNVSPNWLLNYDLEEKTDIGNSDEVKNPDIRAIARAGENMSPDEAAELRKFAERLFPNAFKKKDS